LQTVSSFCCYSGILSDYANHWRAYGLLFLGVGVFIFMVATFIALLGLPLQCLFLADIAYYFCDNRADDVI